jgi:hypothetical protein
MVSPSSIQLSNPSRPLVIVSYILTSQAGKLWTADQLDSIAQRYLTRSARRVATVVRENLNSGRESIRALRAMIPSLPTPMHSTLGIPGQSKLVPPHVTSSPAPMDPAYLYTGGSTSTMGSHSQEKVGEHDVYQQDPHGWNEM